MLTIENVSKKFRRKQVLKNVSLQLDKGCYGLLGPNGAGKTTLLRCILGLYPLNSGNISFDGERTQIGYLPQKFGMFPEMTVFDMLYYFCSIKKIPKTCRKEEIERVLELVNLEDRIQDRVSRLSGGMQRRIGIAQAVLGNPDIVFMDEPTAGLDPEERVRFRSVLEDIKKERTVLVSTHIVEDVESVCERVIIMNQGEILENSSVSEVCRFARGKVFEIEGKNAIIKEPYYLEREFQREGNRYLRILSGQEQSAGVPKEPDLLDGYLARIKGI